MKILCVVRSSLHVALLLISLPTGLLSSEQNTAIFWPTPVLTWRLQTGPQRRALLAGLKEHILALRRKSGGVQRSNIGGWQSGSPQDQDFLEAVANPHLENLRGCIATLVQMYVNGTANAVQDFAFPTGVNSRSGFRVRVTESWANANSKTDWNKEHVHPEASLTGIFYVAATEGSGDLVLTDPRPQATQLLPADYGLFKSGQHERVTPEAGLFVIFPGWLPHYVLPALAGRSKVRLSVAFNIQLSPDVHDQTCHLAMTRKLAAPINQLLQISTGDPIDELILSTPPSAALHMLWSTPVYSAAGFPAAALQPARQLLMRKWNGRADEDEQARVGWTSKQLLTDAKWVASSSALCKAVQEHARVMITQGLQRPDAELRLISVTVATLHGHVEQENEMKPPGRISHAPGAQLCGVISVRPDGGERGALRLQSPGLLANAWQDRWIALKEGEIVLFPCWMTIYFHAHIAHTSPRVWFDFSVVAQFDAT